MKTIQKNAAFVVLTLAAVSFLRFPANAADKKQTELECSSVRVILTCLNSENGHCIASDLHFTSSDGKVDSRPKLKIDLLFNAPTIADEISCVTTKTKSAIAVRYSPGCEYAACMQMEYFDPSGVRITRPGNSRAVENYFGQEAKDQKFGPVSSLREAD